MPLKMFACFGLGRRHKRLSPTSSEVVLPTSDSNPFARSMSVGRGALAYSPPTPHGTPIPKRGSLRKKRKNFEDISELHPVKAPRPSLPNGTVRLPGTGAPPGVATEQLKRLEAELSAKVTEAEEFRARAERHARGMEALAVLLYHLTSTYDAFSTPRLRDETEQLNRQLANVKLSLDESNASVQRCTDAAQEQKADHERQIRELDEKHRNEIECLSLRHEQQLREVSEQSAAHLQKCHEEYRCQEQQLLMTHEKEKEELEQHWKLQMENQHEQQLQALDQLSLCHTEKLREAEEAWHLKERELEEANEKLLKEQSSLRLQARKLEETLLSDKDHRLVAAKNVCTSLQKEVDSLKTVVEMKNSEVHKLRDQVARMERLSQELEIAREKVKSFQAKTEDLQAQMEKKIEEERQLYAENQELVSSIQREMSLNKHLKLENEELQWKLRQREQIMSASMPAATLDLVTRNTPGSARQQEGGPGSPHMSACSPRLSMQTCQNKSSSRDISKRWSVHCGQMLETEHSNSSVETSPRSVHSQSDVTFDSPPPSPCVKGVIEKSNSVSFILDLDDVYTDSGFLDAPPSPRLKGPRTPVTSRRVLGKGLGSSVEKSSSTPFITGNGRETSSKRGSGNKDSLCSSNRLGKMNCKTTTDFHNKCDQLSSKGYSKHDSGQVRPLFNGSASHISRSKSRSHSNSESSDGGEIERISPTGLSWTVPVCGSSVSKGHKLDYPPRLLQQPDEDEYEEMEVNNEIIEVLPLSDNRLSSLLGHRTVTSTSLSDSDVSQCGSHVGSSTESDESSEDEEGTEVSGLGASTATMVSSTPGRGHRDPWSPLDGAGEAMIPAEVLVQCDREGTKKGACKMEIPKHGDDKNSKCGLSSGPSSDSEALQENAKDELNISWSEDVECDLTSSSELQEL